MKARFSNLARAVFPLLIASMIPSFALAQFSPPTNGLVAWWGGEGNANDSSGNGHNGTLLDGVAFDAGKFGQAFSMAGNNNRVLVPDSPDFKLTNSLSIGAWIYPKANSWVILMRNGGPFTPYSFQLDDAGNFQFYIKDASGAQDQISVPISNNQWYQVTATLDGATGDLRLYTNGLLAAQKVTTLRPVGDIDPSNQPTISIGNTPGGQFPFIGLIDEVVLYSRALTPAEIQGIAQQQPPCVTPPSGLVSWWRGEGTTSDQVGGNPGTLVGNVTFGPGKVGQAFVFDGNSDAVAVGNPTNLQLQNFTIETWVKRGSSSSASLTSFVGFIFAYGLGGYALAVQNDGVLMLTKTGVNNVTTASGILTDTNFHHLAVTKGGSTVTFYLDGVAYPVSAYDPGFTFSKPAAIGANGDDLTGSFLGTIDEVSIYNRPLSGPEIQSIYLAGASGKCIPQTAPFILTQPASQTVFVGATATFYVSAGGTQPLSYQWSLNGTNINGAISASLTLTNVQLSQAGAYVVLVTNAAGSTNSSAALLTVNPPPPCVPPAPGLVGWWRAEGDALDQVGSNNGTLFSGTTFAPGEVGQAFNFDGVNSAVVIPASSSLAFQSLTVEAWLLPRDLETPRPIVEYDNPTGPDAMNFWYNIGPNISTLHGGLYGFFRSADGSSSIQVGSPPGLLTNNKWSHVALTYDFDQRVATLYHNGVAVGSVTSSIPVQPQSFMNVNLGYRPVGSSDLFAGRRHLGGLDEVSIYNRALSPAEIQAIYNADASGKCVLPVPPFISAEPGNQTVTVGDTATFSVAAGGSQPLSYQWLFNGANLAGATDSGLVISNAQRSNAGTYAVVVTNSTGSITSSNAILTVNFPPSTVRVLNVTNIGGSLLTVPVILAANGNETALGFSLNFNSSLLTYVRTTAGSGASGTTLLVNSSQAATGRLGIALTMPTGATFPLGNQEVVDVTFTAAIQTNDVSTIITFGDSPVVRQLSDVNGSALPVTFVNGTITLTANGFEADVSPRPNGDGVVGVTDWVLIGRFAARLDYPTNASEFQRADCAPRSTLGNGNITVSDWVQAGRYVAGFDPLTPAGGPTSPVSARTSLIASGSASGPAPSSASKRKLQVANATLAQGQSGSISVNLLAQGDENALSFSLSLDPSQFIYTGASLGGGAIGATLNLNTSQVSSGLLAAVLALPTGTVFPSGIREVLKINLKPSVSASNSYTVSLVDQPVLRETSDPAANELATTYLNGTITVNPVPSLRISQNGTDVTLAWPDWASGFTLQESTGPFSRTNWSNLSLTPSTVNGENSVSLPIRRTPNFYRLYKP